MCQCIYYINLNTIFIIIFIYYATNWYSFEIIDFVSYFDFINHFDFKSFGLIQI